jgi:tetratricopeptide (TPR) repeat protein
MVNEIGNSAAKLRDEVAPSWSDTSKHGVASELVALMQELTKRRSIAVFIDNFHLADYSSENLLSELARTRGRSKLFLVIAFREFELVSAGHPYVAAERRLEMDGKCLRLRPQSVSTDDVREYLLNRFPNNLFPPDLTRVVYEYCRGIPLHLVNLIDYLEGREITVSRDHWVLARSPDQIATDLSAFTDHSMELPLRSVEEHQRHLLAVAALLGERFESGLLAEVVQEDRTIIERELNSVYRTHRIIELAEQSAHHTPYTSSVRYRFSHSSYRDAFLSSFDTLPTERAQLANRAIDLLSTYEPSDPPTHCARIAGLLEYAGRTLEAVHKYAESGQLSSSKFAHGTAALLARRALRTLRQLTEDDSIRMLRMNVNILLGMAVMSTSGFAAPELERIYGDVLQDARRINDAAGERIGLYGMWVFSVDSGRIGQSLEYATHSLTKAVEAGDTAAEVESYYAKGTSLNQLGRFEEAKEQFNLCVSKADNLGLRSHWFYQLDAAVSIRSQLARTLWFLGDSYGAIEVAQRAFEIAEHKSHPESRAYALVFLADVSHLRRDVKAALDFSARAISASIDCGASQELAWAKMIQAWALGQELGDEHGVIRQLEHSFAFYTQLNARVALTKFYCLAAEVYLIQGKTDEAIRQLDHAEKESSDTKESYFESEMKRIRAEALLACGPTFLAQAEANFRESYRIADRIGAKSLRLRTALGLYWKRNEIGISEAEARLLLYEACSSIPASNNDADVQAARGILKVHVPSSGDERG